MLGIGKTGLCGDFFHAEKTAGEQSFLPDSVIGRILLTLYFAGAAVIRALAERTALMFPDQ